MPVPAMSIHILALIEVGSEVCRHCCNARVCLFHSETVSVSQQGISPTSLMQNHRTNVNEYSRFVFIICCHCSAKPNHSSLIVVTFYNLDLDFFVFHKHFIDSKAHRANSHMHQFCIS